MLNQQTKKAIKEILFQYLDPKKDKAFIFGSRADGTARKFSDIDIGIESKRKIGWLTIEGIKETFEESDLPYRVDVVNFKTASKNFRQIARQKIIPLN